MIIGIDFDNTIVSYDTAFYETALEKKLIPSDLPVHKDAIRNYLRSIDKESEWTLLQGEMYGNRMQEAKPFQGVLDFIASASKKHTIYIVSHKTKAPYAGPQYDLHKAAFTWLQSYGIVECLTKEKIFFELTKVEKLSRIGLLNCDVFIDDLPELLEEPLFPKKTAKILFDPNNQHANIGYTHFHAWDEIQRYIGDYD